MDKSCYDIFMSKRQLLPFLSIGVFLLVLIVVVGVYSMLKSVAIEPDVSPKSSWEIKVSKSSYKVDELYPVDPNIPPIVYIPPGVEGKLFGPLNENDRVCQFDVGSQATYLEKYEGDKWIRLCDRNAEHSPRTSLLCGEYNPSEGDRVYGTLHPSDYCEDRSAPIEDGTYRLRAMVYAKCQPTNNKWNNVDPASCQINKEVYSPEFTITN